MACKYGRFKTGRCKPRNQAGKCLCWSKHVHRGGRRKCLKRATVHRKVRHRFGHMGLD